MATDVNTIADPTERAAARCLHARGLVNLVHEPDGNTPPDFVADGRIAIEVRRLNQHRNAAGLTTPLEADSISFNRLVQNALIAWGAPGPGQPSWFVSYRIRRPLPPWRQARRAVDDALARFAETDGTQRTIEVSRSIRLDFHPAAESHRRRFLLGGYIDGDSGGWVVAEMIKNLRICMAEKTVKVRSFESRYPEWWLVLSDRISYASLDDSDRLDLRREVGELGLWSRVVLFNPSDPARSFDLLQNPRGISPVV